MKNAFRIYKLNYLLFPRKTMAFGFGNKEDALKNRGSEDNVLYTKKFNSYYWTTSHQDLIRIIKSKKVSFLHFQVYF